MVNVYSIGKMFMNISMIAFWSTTSLYGWPDILSCVACNQKYYLKWTLKALSTFTFRYKLGCLDLKLCFGKMHVRSEDLYMYLTDYKLILAIYQVVYGDEL